MTLSMAMENLCQKFFSDWEPYFERCEIAIF